jgi:hypothetical protein
MAGSSGIMIQAMKYARNPIPKAKNETAHNTLTSTGSRVKKLPRPPHTPPRMRSLFERYNLFGSMIIENLRIEKYVD